MSSNQILRAEFQRYDRNKDGFISKAELKEVLGKVQALTDQDLEDFIKDNDIDKDGRINYEGKITLKTFISYCPKMFYVFQSLWRCIQRIRFDEKFNFEHLLEILY